MPLAERDRPEIQTTKCLLGEMGNFGVVKWVGWQIMINSAHFFARSFPLARVA